jgi:hypothetical protein
VKRVIALACMLIALGISPGVRRASAYSLPTVVVNGAHLPNDALAEIGGRLYVALRPVAEALGADVRYDSARKQVLLTTVLRQIVFRVGDPQLVVNGQAMKVEAPAQTVGSRVMLPLRGLAQALGAELKQDSATHAVILVLGSGGIRNAPTPPPIAATNTLEGTVRVVSLASDLPSVDIEVSGVRYTITVPANTKVRFRDTHGTVAGDGAVAQVKPGDTLIATLDAQGHVLAIADIFSGTSGTIASVAGQNMVLTSGKVISADGANTTVILDGKPASMADLHAGNIVTVRSDPKTGKVREIVAFTPGRSAENTSATATPGVVSADALRISGVTDNADHPFRLGQTISVAMDGTPGGTATFDLSNVILGTPMRETRPGHYEGSHTVQLGTNLVDAPILVTLSKAGATANAVGPDPLNIITDPPQVKETAPAPGARVNTLRPSIYVTFVTLGGKGMNPNSLALVVDGKDVTAQATRTGAFISYFPATDLHEGAIRVQVKGSDVAGNPLDYSWSFVIASK